MYYRPIDGFHEYNSLHVGLKTKPKNTKSVTLFGNILRIHFFLFLMPRINLRTFPVNNYSLKVDLLETSIGLLVPRLNINATSTKTTTSLRLMIRDFALIVTKPIQLKFAN